MSVFEATPVEKVILQDIQQKTGMTFRKLGGIDTRDKVIADAVLPVLINWADKMDDRHYRRAVYACFHTPHARSHFDQIIRWWISEQDEVASASLTQDLALLVTCKDAEGIWKLCRDLPKRPFHYMLVSKLADCATVATEVKDSLIRALEVEHLRAGDLSYIAKVKDPRISRWFKTQLESPDSNIRALAKRVSSQDKALPKSVEYARMAPDRSGELFSTEVDVKQIAPLLRKLAKNFGVKIPAGVRSGAFLSSADVNHWISVDVLGFDSRHASLWFRLEDIDTVEIVLLQPTASSGTVQ